MKMSEKEKHYEYLKEIHEYMLKFVDKLLDLESEQDILDYVADYPKIDKAWGNEYILMLAGGHVVKLLKVNAGHRTSLQYHSEKYEIMFIVRGDGFVIKELSDEQHEKIELEQGFAIKPKVKHRSVALEKNLYIVELSDVKETDIVRLHDDYGRSRTGL